MKQVNNIWVPAYDTHFAHHLLSGPTYQGAGTYQYNKLRTAVDLCAPDRKRVAVDVGAHVGLWSRVLANEFERVEAFEPVPEHQECFIKNLVYKKKPTDSLGVVTLHKVALGAQPAKNISIVLDMDNSGNAHVGIDKSGKRRTVQVNVDTLDEYNFDVVDFLKIDVEGYELNVIKGGKETIKRCKPVICVEQKPGKGRVFGLADTAAVDLLLTWGYKLAWMKAGDYCLVPEK